MMGNSPVVSLKKPEVVTLQKGLIDSIKVRLAWSSTTYNGRSKFDLDLSAFLLAGDTPEQYQTKADRFVFYYNQYSTHEDVSHSGDVQTQGEEFIYANASTLEENEPDVTAVCFVASIYEGAQRQQNFGMLNDARIEVVNAKTQDVLLDIKLNEDYSTSTSIELGYLVKGRRGWKFESVAAGYNRPLDDFCVKFGLQVE